MGVFGTIRFRVIVIFLLVLIIWQAYKLYPSNEPPQFREVNEPSQPNQIIDVAVYYEALCPDSRHFFIHHLEPTYNKLLGYLSLSLIPYGKAKTIIGPDGSLDFECQHGELECQANKIHACSVELIHDAAEQLRFVNCMIRDNLDPLKALQRCGALQSVDIAPIEKCAKGLYGSDLLKRHGEATKIIQPTFIPTVLLGGSKDNQGGILKNFILEVCQLFSPKKPIGCP